jgi:hypothetical protein
MPDGNLRNVAIATMWVLMAETQEVSNPDLQKRHGVYLEKADREKLVNLGYITSEFRGRTYFHKLAEGGWSWCRQQMGAERPDDSGAMGGALYAVLRGLQRFSDAKDFIPSEIFSPAESSERAQPDSIEARIRAAYRKLAKHPGAWVSLTDLRPMLGDLAKKSVDDVLRRMDRAASVSIVPEENRRALTPADKAAAVRIGSHDNHYIAIEGA